VSDVSTRVLVWAPRGRDAMLAVQLIERHEIAACEVHSLSELLEGITTAGCAVIAAEALVSSAAREQLRAALAAQPPWSDFPIVLFTNRGIDHADEALAAVTAFGNVTLLPRPVQSGTLITALVAALRGRRRQYEARDAIAGRDQFLAMLGHELRNPLGAITLALETMPEAPGTERSRTILDGQTRHLSRLVNDLLDVARVTSGKVHLQIATLDLGHVARRCILASEQAARARGITLEDALGPVPLLVDGDLVRLEEVFTNLLFNAIKYSHDGSRVTLRSRLTEHSCAVDVIDTGIGIAPGMLDRVFELFAQADVALVRSAGGLGIGLTLVKSLVQLHHGTVTASSKGLGRGSTFTVEFPRSFSPLPAAPASALATPAARPQRVLLVEDNPDLLDLTKAVLEARGCEVECAIDGADGLERLVASGPDIAFIDIGLPELDGYGVASRAREQGVTSYLVAMTGYGQPADRRRSNEAGFDYHLTKPVSGEMLLDALTAAGAR